MKYTFCELKYVYYLYVYKSFKKKRRETSLVLRILAAISAAATTTKSEALKALAFRTRTAQSA